jgi:hypothetical protein
VRSRGADFFISHAGRDTAWAEWLAWQLQELGYTVELDVWDWAPGEDFVARMAAALESADRLLAVCSQAYFASPFGGAELRAAFTREPAGDGRIVPVLVEPVTLPALYAPLIHLDLAGLDEATAADRLRRRLTGLRPAGPPPFPALAGALSVLGEAEPARALAEDTLVRCRRVLGPDHPITQSLTQTGSPAATTACASSRSKTSPTATDPPGCGPSSIAPR